MPSRYEWTVEIVGLDRLKVKLNSLEVDGWEIFQVQSLESTAWDSPDAHGFNKAAFKEAERKAESEGLGPKLIASRTTCCIVARR
jgi:hypothetical protein